MTTVPDLELRDRAVEVLCDPTLADVVDVVCWPEGDVVCVANADGAARLSPDSTEVLHGRNPVALQDPLAFTPLTVELADPSPPNSRNS
ncbi:MAG: nucleotide pyrophosphatase, partial [Frankiales bacterium]|nr:nucleotide pyrophosphatase [Frankiales bacterium]